MPYGAYKEIAHPNFFKKNVHSNWQIWTSPYVPRFRPEFWSSNFLAFLENMNFM